MTDCPRSPRGPDLEFLDRFYRKMVEHRVPLAGSLELTRRCNLRCVHCYLAADARDDAVEPDTAAWREIVDQAVGAGCLDLLITGGEPLLRRDFPLLYAHARERGTVITVFTNATLVTDDIARCFRRLPPQLVEVTLYGATAPTYERITGVPGSHARCLEGVRRLLEAGVKVGLKTMLMTLNRHELDAMRRLSADLGVGFRFDAALFPTLCGDRSPTSLRVAAEQAVADELALPGALESWRRLHDRLGGEPAPDTLYHCAAGHTGFHVDASGCLLPCLMAAGPGFPVLFGGGFALGWREAVPRMVGRKADPGARCHRCSIRVLCGHCPAFSRLEMGDERLASPYLCAMAHHRAEAVLDALPARRAEP